MSDNIVNMADHGLITRVDLPAERILRPALEADLEDAIVIGHRKDGEFYFAGTMADGGEVLWLMELAKKFMMENFHA